MPQLVHIASISGSHGVRGEFKLFCLLESPASISQFGEFFDEHGKPLDLTIVSSKSKQPIARLPHVADKNAADLLKDKKIFVAENAFAGTDEDEFYAYQLVGLKVLDSNSSAIGTVKALQNFGAGDLLEIEFFSGNTELYPFQDEVFPEINLEAQTITFIEPEYV